MARTWWNRSGWRWLLATALLLPLLGGSQGAWPPPHVTAEPAATAAMPAHTARFSSAASECGTSRPTYDVVDLGTQGPLEWQPWKLNDNGDILWRGIERPLKTLAAISHEDGAKVIIGPLSATSVIGADINNAGQVVGSYNLSTDAPHSRGFLYSNGQFFDLHELVQDPEYGPHIWFTAWAISDAGVIVGQYFTFDTHAPASAAITLVELAQVPGAPHAYFDPRAINATGQLLGYLNVPSTQTQVAALYANGEALSLQPPGTLGSAPIDINNRGDVLVSAWSSADAMDARLYLFRDGNPLALPGVGANGYASYGAFNNAGQVVGTTKVSHEPFLYQDGVVSNLNDLLVAGSEWTISAPIDINDTGEIVATATRGSGQNTEYHALLLKPGGPAISSFAQTGILVGGGSSFVTICGKNFEPGSVATWDGSPLATTFISGEELLAEVPVGDLVRADQVTLAVANPDGKISNGMAAKPLCTSEQTFLDICALLAGDILLVDGQPTVAGIGVGSYWFHSGLYVGGGYISQAVGDRPNPADELVTESILGIEYWWTSPDSDWAVVRPSVAESVRQAAVDYARVKADQVNPPIPYNNDWFNREKTLFDETTFYCNQLVWKAYERQGVNLESAGFDGIATWSDVITGNKLYNNVAEGKATLVAQKDDARRAVLRLHSPADLLLVDDQGRRTGHDPHTGQTYAEIPGVAYSGPDSHPETLTIRDLDAAWTLSIIGTGVGTYTVEAETIDKVAPNYAHATQSTVPGRADTFRLAPGENQTHFFQPSGASASPSATPSPRPAMAGLTIAVAGNGAVAHAGGVAPAGTTSLTVPLGAVATLTSQPAVGQTFTGWVVDGVNQGWAPSLTVTMNGPHAVRATFMPTATFPDVGSGRADFTAITELASRGTIRGYANGNYGPDDGVQRAQMAALIARAMPAGPDAPPTTLAPPACLAGGTWDCEDWGNAFQDRNGLDANLWRNVGVLQHYQVAFGYDGAACTARGVASPCFAPTAPVSYVETITFITRAMIAKGYWTMQAGASQPYAGVPGVFAPEVATYHFYTQAAGGVPAPPANWNAGATRGWFAMALWQALNAYWAVDRTP